MTYRMVPPHTWGHLQKLILIVTAILGASIACAPPDRDAKLTFIEAAMSADHWAIALMVCSIVALIAEIDMDRRHHDKWMNVVAYLHIVMCSLIFGYSFAALAGVLVRAWWNFGAPALGGLLAYLHMIFVRRRPRAHR